MAAVLGIHLARRNDPDLDREVGPSTRRFDRRVRLWGHFILRAAGIDNDKAYQSLQLLNNPVTRDLTVEYIRNPDMNLIDRMSKRLNSSHQCATRLPSSACIKKAHNSVT